MIEVEYSSHDEYIYIHKSVWMKECFEYQYIHSLHSISQFIWFFVVLAVSISYRSSLTYTQPTNHRPQLNQQP